MIPVIEDESMPPNAILFVFPGEEIEIVKPDGSRQTITLKEPQIHLLYNLGPVVENEP